jgi:hypothetical protein
MPALISPGLVTDLSGGDRQLAEALEKELQRLVELRAKPDPAEVLKREAPRSAREATSITLSRRATIVGVWELALKHFEDGSNAAQAHEMLQAIQYTIDNWLRAARDCRDLWRLAAEVGGSPEGLEGLEAAEREVKQIAAAVENMRAFMTRTRPPIAPDALERGRKEIAENRYRTGDQIRCG